MSYPQDYKPGVNTKVEVKTQTQVGVIVTEADRKQLIEQRKRLQAEAPGEQLQDNAETAPQTLKQANQPTPTEAHPEQVAPRIQQQYLHLDATKQQFNTNPPWTVRPTPIDPLLGSTWEGR